VITSAQCRAARALLNWDQKYLADKAGVGIVQVIRCEAGKKIPSSKLLAIRSAFVKGGVEFGAQNGSGPGVRIRNRIASPGNLP